MQECAPARAGLPAGGHAGSTKCEATDIAESADDLVARC